MKRNSASEILRAAKKARALQRSEAIAASKRIERLLGEPARFYELGAALAQFQDQKLYLGLEHHSFASWIKAEGRMSEARANRLIAIARAFEREDATALGPEKAFAYLRYARAAGLRMPLSARSEVGGVSLHDISTRALLRAVRGVRDVSRVSAEDKKRFARARRIEQQLAKTTKGEVSVRVLRRRGSWRMIVDLPFEAGLKAFVPTKR